MMDRGHLLTAFLVALTSSFSAQAKDVLLYSITKGIHHQQTNGAAPAVLPENGYVFQANVLMAMDGAVRGATVRSQEGTIRVLTGESADELEFRNRVNSRTTLETRYPDGNFTFTMDTLHDGNKSIVLQLTGGGYPNVPRIVNFVELQTANADAYIVVRWDSFVGGSAADFIQLRIEDSNGDRAFETPDYGDAGALDGTATYAVLEPGTLDPAKTYDATVRFERTSSRNDTAYTGVPGWSTYHALTRFQMITRPALTPLIEFYELSKGRYYEQADLGQPFPDPDDEYRFLAMLQATSPNAVRRVTLSPPAGDPLTLVPDGDNEEFQVSEPESDPALFEATYPNGSYTFQIETMSAGDRSATLILAGNNYPPAPHVQFDPQQSVRADRDLTISWDPWPGGTANDFVQLRIEDASGDNVFETDDLGENDALNGRSTFAVIPQGTLDAGRTYSARLYFRRYTQFDTASLPGALGAANYFSRLKFDIETVPPDVHSFAVTKGAEYIQSSIAESQLSHFVFQANVVAQRPGSVSSVTLLTPGGTLLPLTLQADDQTFAIAAARPSLAELNTAYPDGNYVININGVNDGFRTVTAPLAGQAFPNPPRLNNFEHAGRVDYFNDFAITWDAFLNGTIDDFIHCSLSGPGGVPVFRTGEFGQGSALFGLHTEAIIGGETLMPGTYYTGSLLFEKVVNLDDESYPEALGRISYFARTRFSLVTMGIGNPAAVLPPQLLSGNQVQLTFKNAVGAAYVVEGSSDLKTWTPIGTLSPAESPASIVVPRPGSPAYFFRTYIAR